MTFPPFRFLSPRLGAVLFAAGLSTLLTGCGAGNNFSATGAKPVTGLATLTGSVHGGQQPVTGATIALYAAGIPATGSNYGVGATPIPFTVNGVPNSTVTTDANGAFSITGTYTCPSPAQQVYIVATGGNPGIGGGGNGSIAMMAALGTCPAGGNLLATIPFIAMNEVTTVSAVWALQQFMAAPAAANKLAPAIGAPTTTYSTGTTVGAVASGVIGLNNAFSTAKIMADIATGLSPNTNYPYATPESAKINTLADILAYCINSDPATSTNCSQLFAATTPAGSFTAADTIQAAWYMAQNPTSNVVTLFNFIAPTAPFQPTYLAPLTPATGGTTYALNGFNDTTLAINYAPVTTPGTSCTQTVPTTCAISDSGYVAIDAFGNAWLTNIQAPPITNTGTANPSVVQLGVDGSLITTQVTSFTTSATAGSAPQFTVPPAPVHTVTGPRALAVDLSNQAWFANTDAGSGTVGTTTTIAGSVGVLSTSNAPLTGGTGTTVPTIGGYLVGGSPYGIAVDGTNNVFVSNTGVTNTGTTNPINYLDSQSLAKIVSGTGAYSYSTSTAAVAPNQLPSASAAMATIGNSAVDVLAIDNNPNGQTVWVGTLVACNTTKGVASTVAFPYGMFSQFADATLTPLAGSNLVTAASGATLGAGTATNCGNASESVAQLLTAVTTNPAGIAIDRNNGVWATDQLNTSLKGFDGVTYLSAPTSATGIVPASVTYVNGPSYTTYPAQQAGTGLLKPAAVAVDGNNNAWIASAGGRSLGEASYNATTSSISLLTPGQGGAYGTLAGGAYGLGFVHQNASNGSLAIDPSGNIWLANTNGVPGTSYTNQSGQLTSIGYSVTVVVGAAGPVVTPIALAVKSGKIGAKP